MVIGITGGIGSGKSVVTSLLRDKFDAAVIDTDTIGHEIMEIGKSAYKKVVEIFGNKVIAEDGSIDKEKAGKIFESQNTEEEFRQIADDIIDNSGSEAETEIQIKNILESY